MADNAEEFVFKARDYGLVILFIVGYIVITLEGLTGINKAIPALLMAVFMWVSYFASEPKAIADEDLAYHLADVCSVVIFLLGTVAVVELMDIHGAFKLLRRLINIRSKKLLLVLITWLTFLMSSFIANYTTTIGMCSLIRIVIDDKNERLIFGSMVVIASNAGGAWTVIGDVTTTMLWIANRVSIVAPMKELLLPSIVHTCVALGVMVFFVKGNIDFKALVPVLSPIPASQSDVLSTPVEVVNFKGDTAFEEPIAKDAVTKTTIVDLTTPDDLKTSLKTTTTTTTTSSTTTPTVTSPVPTLLRKPGFKGALSTLEHLMNFNKPNPHPSSTAVVITGVFGLIFIPFFSILTGLPPYMGIILAMCLIWIVSEKVHGDYNEKMHMTVLDAFTRIDMASIFFFLGILLAVATLDASGLLSQLATKLDTYVQHKEIVALLIGFVSAIIDNVPLVAASIGMYDLPTDHPFWMMVAYCAGTGGSILVIGSAAGIAFMSLENVSFFWYFKHATPIALLGYLAGFAFYILQTKIGISASAAL
mmetsp:Transcript_852/g.1468  ORF Transcript_852/g.1468 Transcript_852/m.1468 type:complete len:534 (-) Transcript_852:394-1995(-)